MNGTPSTEPDEHPVRALGRRLDTARRRRGWTYREFEKQTGVSKSTLQYLIRTRQTVPDYYELTALVAKLGIAWDSEWERLWRRAADIEPANGHDVSPRTPATAGPRPAQLPMDVAGFTGRAAELAELDQLLDEADRPGGRSTAVVISTVSGTAGVGKTALAIHWAHRIRDRFGDGHLYLDLRGYDPDHPIHSTDALESLLRGLGVAGPDIPPSQADRAALYRTLLDRRRMLIVLDNARGTEQIRDLLPGTPGCLVLVTSRDALTGLVARHGAHRVDLDLLPAADAVTLLRTLIGHRATAEPAAAAELADRCARLPLALRIAADLATTRPDESLADLVADLARHGLDLLDAGDERTTVRAVFSWSYQALPTGAARVFRLLGLHPGPDLDTHAVAALADIATQTAADHLTTLERAHLVQQPRHGRYRMHDLLRAYAAQLATADADRHAALGRLLDHYTHTAGAAADLLYPADRGHDLPRAVTPLFDSPARAAAWLDTERDNLLAAAKLGSPTHTTILSATLRPYLYRRARNTDAHALHTHALANARRTGDRAAELAALTGLGDALVAQDRYEEAEECFEQALTIARHTGNRTAEPRTLRSLGRLRAAQDRHDTAIDLFEHALAISRDTGNRTAELYSLRSLAQAHADQGRYDTAAGYYEQALTIARAVGNRHGELHALAGLGGVHIGHGRYDTAADLLDQALAIARDTGDRTGELHALAGLGDLHRAQGHRDVAADYYNQTLRIAADIDNQPGQLRALRGLSQL